MKALQLCLISSWLLFVVIPEGFAVQRVDCQWGSYGHWSECDGCTRSQTRTRAMVVYAQFGGNLCYGDATQTRVCETTRGCPLEDGCGDRFRCRSGKCIHRSLVCNGDQDCEEDGLDELGCDSARQLLECPSSVLPPAIEKLGQGFDAASGKGRASVINTKSFGGQCLPIFSGLHSVMYRLPLCTLKYSFVVTVQNDISDEMYQSRWHYAKDVVKRETVKGTTSGYANYNFHESHLETQNRRLLVIKNDIELAQFQMNSPQYLTVSEELWKALVKLPAVYNYAAYGKILERFGTHYLSEGSLGGSFKTILSIDEETSKRIVEEKRSYNECERVKRWFLFFPITIERCKSGSSQSARTTGGGSQNNVAKVLVDGGSLQHIAALKTMDLNNLERNWAIYSSWAESVRSFPEVIKQKLRPLSELVKSEEVQCGGVKKLYLRRAIEQHLAERDACHCRACSNNGMAAMDRSRCKCICKPGTSGEACEQGSELEGQQGVIHGSWSCWSGWSSCIRSRRSRSRSCSRPSPQGGGQHCTGEATETSDCEDQELQYLKTMEPQCFPHTPLAQDKCEPPPALINGIILDPKDVYLVGSKVEYTCTDGYHLIGPSAIRCTADQTWSAGPGMCTLSMCRLQPLPDDVIASPVKQSYAIGETVTLSCPEGRRIEGETTIICDASLQFSPDTADITCSRAPIFQQRILPDTSSVQCDPWKKLFKGKCICKMPFECKSSLELCAIDSQRGRSVPLSVCKMQALLCMGRNLTIADNSACRWPQRATTGCANCHMWETCEDQTNECRCKDTADCLAPGSNVCVRVGEDVTTATQAMSECEAGLRQCKGEKVSVVDLQPCTS
ncbi:complement component C7 [Genypterus blacodes]|uniref:complement component C7 n=1 Tax=Genypterus blacodes TaxID=154954 RepID=UPI003F776E18